jgi:hypothetical protein
MARLDIQHQHEDAQEKQCGQYERNERYGPDVLGVTITKPGTHLGIYPGRDAGPKEYGE